MLRKIRLIFSFISFTLITLLFLDFTGTLHAWFGWLAKIQFFPAVLALNVAVIVFLVLLTLLFGRVYCSVICPLGIFQDIIAWFGRRRKKFPYSYSPAKNGLRNRFLVGFFLAFTLGSASLSTSTVLPTIVSLLDPYAAYGRMANTLFLPVWKWGNNLLAHVAEHVNSYAFYNTDIWLKSLPVLIVAIVTFLVLLVLAWRNGRTYCNTVCPVGTVLGFISRFSLMRIVINADKCNACKICTRTCKASCIDFKEHKIDYSRCVACMNCIGKCKQEAIAYQFAYSKKAPKTVTVENKSGDTNRRGFLSVALLFIAAGLRSQTIEKAKDVKVDRGLANVIGKKKPTRRTPITPPGSVSARNLRNHCIACQLCVTVCGDNQVLRPMASGLYMTLMQPEMSFERGFCRPECTKCSEVCPTGAIIKISKEVKSSTQIGHAVWIHDKCLPFTDGYECGNCARHCPVGAITMIPSEAGDDTSMKIPAVNEERCIGCGACEYVCPSRPLSAIYVEGHQIHKIV